MNQMLCWRDRRTATERERNKRTHAHRHRKRHQVQANGFSAADRVTADHTGTRARNSSSELDKSVQAETDRERERDRGHGWAATLATGDDPIDRPLLCLSCASSSPLVMLIASREQFQAHAVTVTGRSWEDLHACVSVAPHSLRPSFSTDAAHARASAAVAAAQAGLSDETRHTLSHEREERQRDRQEGEERSGTRCLSLKIVLLTPQSSSCVLSL